MKETLSRTQRPSIKPDSNGSVQFRPDGSLKRSFRTLPNRERRDLKKLAKNFVK